MNSSVGLINNPQYNNRNENNQNTRLCPNKVGLCEACGKLISEYYIIFKKPINQKQVDLNTIIGTTKMLDQQITISQRENASYVENAIIYF